MAVIGLFSGLLGCKSDRVLTTKRLEKKLKIKDFDFDYMRIKSKVRFNDGGKDQKVSGYIQMKKDSIIWMTLSKTSVEGLRIVVTKDTLMMLDRLNKQYYTFNYPQLKERFNFDFDFDMLQSVITGNLYLQSTALPKPQKMDSLFIIKELIEGIAVENQVSRENNKLARVEVLDQQNNKLTIAYDDFKEVGKQLISHHNKSNLSYAKDGVAYETELELTYTKVTVMEKPLKFSFRISPKYKKGEL